ncbi:hypothetical protein [Arthrobacter sp. UYEF3]|uniref:hypothetical protein n=1 Tax=Arthrobacter sp. UYEF3 TaxID=1756365 RepID=UPI003395010E
MVAIAGSADRAAPPVVLLHGRGSNEHGIIGLAEHLPDGATYAAVRAPIAARGGWIADRIAVPARPGPETTAVDEER